MKGNPEIPLLTRDERPVTLLLCYTYCLVFGLRRLAHRTALLGYQTIGSRRTFAFDGRSYPYFYAGYNVTHLNERTVEIPIAQAFLHSSQRALEVGNVLNHYAPFRHDVIDKWERAPNVINCDIREYRTPQRYERIVLISTLEHVGWDEIPKQPENLSEAMTVLCDLLAPEGQLLATLPVGYNLWLDDQLRENRLPFTRLLAMQRTSWLNRWEECSVKEALSRVYGKPYGWANGLIFAYLSTT